MNRVIDKGFRSCLFVSTIVKHPVLPIFSDQDRISIFIFKKIGSEQDHDISLIFTTKFS